MAWFARDHTGRPLTNPEQVFLAAVVELLSEVQPAQVDDSETALTAERDACLIVLIPHRALGGISIVVWLTATEGAVTLAQVAGLDVSHDSLDLGVWVSRVKLDPSRPDFALLLKRIREQLFAPLTVRLYESNRATVWVRDEKSVLRRVGDLGAPPGWFDRIARRAATGEAEVRFVDRESPPVTAPAGVNEWFTTSRGA
jgi:hypothetical protein